MDQTNGETEAPAKHGGWVAKFRDAFRGIALGVRGQSSFYVHFAVALAVVIAGWLLQVTLLEWGLLILCITIVLVAEMFNSALEALAKAYPAEHPATLVNVTGGSGRRNHATLPLRRFSEFLPNIRENSHLFIDVIRPQQQHLVGNVRRVQSMKHRLRVGGLGIPGNDDFETRPDAEIQPHQHRRKTRRLLEDGPGKEAAQFVRFLL